MTAYIWTVTIIFAVISGLTLLLGLKNGLRGVQLFDAVLKLGLAAWGLMLLLRG